MALTESQSLAKNRFYILDLMRFLAALAVVFYHYSIYFPDTFLENIIPIANYGYLGVPFFFMLSGFVITASAFNRSAIQFALSRVARLYPAFWACLLFTFLVVVVCGAGNIGAKQLIINATILNDYVGVKNIDDVYWTLQAEIKFYACVFILLTLNLFRYVKSWLVIWLLLAISHHFYSQPFFLGWLINPGYSFYFIGGICSYLLYENKKDRLILSMLFVAMIFSMIKASHQVNDFYATSGSIGAYIATSVVAIFYIFFLLLSFGFLNLKCHRIIIGLGAISYPLYLCHNRAGKALIDFFTQFMSLDLAIVVIFSLIIGVSYFVHFFIEKELSKLIISCGQFSIKKIIGLVIRNKANS